jgi:hypothetical protein
LGNQNPQDLVRLGPAVVSELKELEVCVAFDVVEFVNAVPWTLSENKLVTDSEELTLWKRNSTCCGDEQSGNNQR